MSKNTPANVRPASNAAVFTLHAEKMRRKAIPADIDDLMNTSNALAPNDPAQLDFEVEVEELNAEYQAED